MQEAPRLIVGINTRDQLTCQIVLEAHDLKYELRLVRDYQGALAAQK
jgi:hypothetical protein